MDAGLGLALHPEPQLLALLRGVIEDECELFEVSPDQLWLDDVTPSPRREALLELVQRAGKPVLGHGLTLSLGGVDDDDRLDRQLARVARDHAEFGFQHYSEHLGFTAHGGRELALPLPLPMTDQAVEVVATRLRRLGQVVGRVAFENSAYPFLLGDPADEPRFLNAIAEAADCGLLLDLHNAHVHCVNHDLDLTRWLEGIDSARVVELHLSGGSQSDPAWLPSGRTLRIDSHDGPIPDAVWEAYQTVLPRCPGLRAVIVERIRLAPDELEGYQAEVLRAKELLCSVR
jgi:uncharacterized protein